MVPCDLFQVLLERVTFIFLLLLSIYRWTRTAGVDGCHWWSNRWQHPPEAWQRLCSTQLLPQRRLLPTLQQLHIVCFNTHLAHRSSVKNVGWVRVCWRRHEPWVEAADELDVVYCKVGGALYSRCDDERFAVPHVGVTTAKEGTSCCFLSSVGLTSQMLCCSVVSLISKSQQKIIPYFDEKSNLKFCLCTIPFYSSCKSNVFQIFYWMVWMRCQ